MTRQGVQVDCTNLPIHTEIQNEWQRVGIELQLEANNRVIGNARLEKEDNSWQEFQFASILDEGLQIIGVRLLNNAVIHGKDRNAVIDWIRLEKK